MAENERDERPIVKAYSAAPGSIASMADSDLTAGQPNAMDPAVIATIKARENGVQFMNLEQLAAARKKIEAGGGNISMLAAGDKVYHKEQQTEATFVEDSKKPGMCIVKKGSQRFRVKKDQLVKL